MSISKSQVFLAVFIICFIPSWSIALGMNQNNNHRIMNVLHIGDYVEAVTSVSAACANVSASQNVTKKLLDTFSNCLSENGMNLPTQFLGQLAPICNDQFKYIKCWEDLNKQIVKDCGEENQPLVPALFVGTVVAICASDLGEKKIGELTNPANALEVQERCQNADVKTIENFREHCQHLMVGMESGSFCIRRKAIETCLDKLFSLLCDSPLPTFFGIYKKTYGDLTGLLPCE
ncbi:hypothetical protein Ocin01_13335 [Orchesella cincta]|uniref:Uncharacterized protein n=1 Tax=Orchesella cincta TaxID=48709 RepID=A0A1D2MJX8_ORCCI|nr:hypothetical protein Ocin01_13335 [Orchesella cincta]